MKPARFTLWMSRWYWTTMPSPATLKWRRYETRMRSTRANFMDIRTTARSLDVAFGFSMLLDNPSTRVILVNVHGGGMQPCDTIVDGLGIAKRRTGRSLPTVVRLAGNNAEFARSRFV